jgi:transposase
MTPNFTNIQIYVKPGITDMRKQVNGLSILAEEDMKLNPGSGNLFLFCSRDKKLLKSIWWDKNGFCLFQKRLEKGKHPWPDTEEQAREIDSGQLKMLLDGIDFWNAHETLSYQEIT